MVQNGKMMIKSSHGFHFISAVAMTSATGYATMRLMIVVIPASQRERQRSVREASEKRQDFRLKDPIIVG